MKKALMVLALAASGLTAACTDDYGYGGGYGGHPGYAGHHRGYDGGYGRGGDWGYYDRGYYSQYGGYDYDRPDPRYNGYYAERYYRADPRYGERRLSMNDRVYRGGDGRYYCRRSDGTTGLIVGGLAGAALGSMIAQGDSRPLGAIIGGIGGAAAGAAIDSNNVRCR
ncbi:MAG TPA: glycine zipper 2TM domain-containing protein [Novosphingobium capsulatum]|nr:glycine zipper 2TM domain-containing protein [Novosphingobium capsulatum]